ncbi:E3 ubiquitin-protein ligase BRE1-like 2 isoform X3 [Gossypium australe]|uniref:E3 ubiquitin protein ligase n=1 Tax=Gossypium australe TaxID=47621 RepID=A0A5B6VP48_9ROSI|nr:E3 ubiquitin-protein ligase BRE1-like 2 isoform X3 [Gossypium australe]
MIQIVTSSLMSNICDLHKQEVLEFSNISFWDVLELTEAIKSKDRESETYISEIETIGQAYEDMQTQNQHLLQQMTERDDYNIKVHCILYTLIFQLYSCFL